MIHDIMPGTQAALNRQVSTGYIGFDPTADSLHIGNLAPIMLLVHFQRCGHKPIALVGGATGMVGDPSGKSKERKLLSEEQINYNLSSQREQLMRFLHFDHVPNPARVVNNYDWFKEITFIDFIRDIGKHITINYMLAKDAIGNRLKQGLSFTEFSYQLMQGYDFYWLNKHRDCTLQMGGADQWGNIVTGTEIIRKKGRDQAFSLTCPLITKADGSKFGKSETGNVWLDPRKTSPYKFYQFWRNVADNDLARLLRYFTLFTQEEIAHLEQTYKQQPNALKKVLAQDVTTRVHSEAAAQKAAATADILFGKKGLTALLKNLDESYLIEVLEGLPIIDISKETFCNSQSLVHLLSSTTDGKIFSSKSEAKRMIDNAGVSINKTKVKNTDSVTDYELLHNKYLLIQKGKKYYYLLRLVD